MSESIVFAEPDDGVASVTINQPATRNALSLAVMEDLIDTLAEAGRRTDVRVLIVRTAGHVFSSGHDLGEIGGADLETQQEIFDACSRLMQLIQTIPQPVIAQVQGVATAAGCQLVAACDLAVAAESARFATPGVKIGLFCSTPMVALSRAVPVKQAMRMLLTGDFVTAADALRFGLVSDVVADDELEAAATELARKVASASSATVAIGKAAFYEQRELPVADAYARMSQVMAHNAVATDAQEGIDAFLTKREPQWQHRG
ncbi:enoyl-CoA hydratase [Brevibacterium spongiae]|uniref:Enoyl-CoA hydratase domain-containing protein 3, mitochondrial n=1 Tax=Brevibacterium spongiae TaxID=2909672 RepID=A0ABY5SMM0_9MICO|nr:enoyl-CoA hydratase [Brevibacterium spongiae]UVI35820.1 enoyl-CoA hydratase [Brevibacterium spongiae]